MFPLFNSYGFPGFGPGASVAFGLVAIIVLVWSFIWKGLALWRAARRGETYWFVALLIINTLGILEILYLYVFSKPDTTATPKPPTTPTMG